MSTGVGLTARERAVVNAFQDGFPITDRPFEPTAAAVRDRGVEICTMTHGHSEDESVSYRRQH